MEGFFAFENNLLAFARGMNRAYALCRPSHVDFGVDKYSSSLAAALFKKFFLDEDVDG